MRHTEQEALHFTGLNGLRAIAALSVVFAHTTIELKLFGLDSFVFGKYPDGNPKATLLAGFGVTIFFTLSGFLITYLLLSEKKVKEISIKNFYIRRILRIWPLYYLYLALAVITLVVFGLEFEKTTILYYVFLLANIPFIFGTAHWFLGHYWSLGVEEQFYSFWPWIVKKSSSILKTSIILCCLLIFINIVFYIILKKYNITWLYTIVNVTRFQCMLIGAIGAILFFRQHEFFLKITNNKLSQAFSWFIILLVAINKFHIISLFDNEFISVITVALIIGQIEKTNRLINLDISFFDFLGKISYGIYVIHPLLLFYLSKIMKFENDSFFNYVLVYLVVFSVTIFLAYLSYQYFERVFLRLKQKYTTVKSSGTKYANG